MKTVKDVMSEGCLWISPEANIPDAARLMRDKDIGFLPVGENNRLIGVITDRDITIRVVATRRDGTEISVRDIMTKKLLYCYDDMEVDACAKNMAAMQVRRLPVIDRNKRLVGVVSFADLAAAATPAVFVHTLRQITAKPQKIAIQAANIA